MEDEINFNVGVILPAAGSGERLGNSTPKQYFEIQGKPLFLHAVERFEEVPWVSSIVVVSDDVSRMESILAERKEGSGKVTITRGGNTRHRSIQAGLAKLQATGPCEVIVVHDAVRPLVPLPLLSRLVLSARDVGAAGATRPLISTVVAASSEGFLMETLDRDKFLNSETPQAFKSSVLTEAYQKISAEELERGTECLQLVLRHCGVRAKLVEGPEDLWKVTLRRDLHSAIGCITAINTRVCIINSKDQQEAEIKVIASLKDSLSCRVASLRHISDINNACCNGYATETYNNVIVFHGCEIEKNCVPLSNLIDLESQGMIIHVLLKDQMIQEEKENLYRDGSQIISQYVNYKKGQVVLYWNQIMEYQRLVTIISNVIFSDNAFAGQILFL